MPRPLAPPRTPPRGVGAAGRRSGRAGSRRCRGRRRIGAGAERASTGWPRSGSTRPGTRPRRARTRCPPPACRPSCRCAAGRCWSGGPRRAATSIPQIDCEADSGVSRRQAQLTTDGTRWWVEDLESANGTFVAPASDAAARGPDPGRGQAGAGRRRPGLPRRLDPDRDPAGHRRGTRRPSASGRRRRCAANTFRFSASGCGTVADDRHEQDISGGSSGDQGRHPARQPRGRGGQQRDRPRTSRRRSSAALADDTFLRLTDDHGRKVLIPAAKIAYIDLGEENARRVGFGTL